MIFNRIYGILATALNVSNPLRYSDAVATNRQVKLLKALDISESYDAELFIDFTIKLLSCAPEWVSVMQEFDPNNSYDIEVINHNSGSLNTLSFNPLNRLVEWATKVPESSKFPTADTDPVIDNVICKLLGVLTDE